MIHRTREGKELLLAELEDTYLTNIINLKLDTLEIAKRVLRETTKRHKFDEALYGELMSEEKARNFVAGLDRNVAPYLVEALIRGLEISTYVKRYQDLIERYSKIKISLAQRRNLIEFQASYGSADDEDEYPDE